MGWCEMVGDYNDDSSVKENLNLLLCLTRVEANVDSLDEGVARFPRRASSKNKIQGRLEGLPQVTWVLGASAATPSNSRLL